MIRLHLRLRNDDGNILITVVLISMVVGALAALTLSTGSRADRTSASDRNSEIALAVADAGVQKTITTINAQATAAPGDPCHVFSLTFGSSALASCFDGATPQGAYDVEVKRTPQGFEVDAQGATGGQSLGRKRHIKVTLMPPRLFSESERYTLFSYTSIDLKNNDEILAGDVWANDSVLLRNGTVLAGSVTAAQGWVQLEANAVVEGNVWSGGYNGTEDWAISLAGGSRIGETADNWAKASVLNPGCPSSDESHYRVIMGGGTITGKVTSFGPVVGTGYGSIDTPPSVCTASSPLKPLPVYTFNERNFASVQRFDGSTAVTDFQNYVATNQNSFSGTFVIDTPTPSQTNRLDLSGVSISGDTTIVTNAPVFTGSIDDDSVPDGSLAQFVVVSRYAPPTSTGCDVNHDGSECSIHVKNNFDFDAGTGTCKTAVLMYANNGPIAVKNNQTMCGTIISNSILIKNNQTLDWDDRFSRALGFGPQTFEIAKWEELPTR